MKLTKDNITKTTGKFKPKAIIVMVDEMTEVMSGSDYKIVSKIQDCIGSIARLGRAAGCHLVLATQRPSSNVINADLKGNIKQSILLGDFDSGISSLVFDEDVSHLSEPEIRGRGFVKSGKEIEKFQSYYTDPKIDFEYVYGEPIKGEGARSLEEILNDNQNQFSKPEISDPEKEEFKKFLENEETQSDESTFQEKKLNSNNDEIKTEKSEEKLNDLNDFFDSLNENENTKTPTKDTNSNKLKLNISPSKAPLKLNLKSNNSVAPSTEKKVIKFNK